MHRKNLKEWLCRLQSLHAVDMDLSLERVREVAERLDLLKPTATVITVGGTNGKGSCVAALEAFYMAEGYKVGAFTSPALFRHNEYVRVQRVNATDEQFCQAFEKIDAARGDITLTLFEFNALAAFIIFQAAELDVWILEVGLGGRFDAVNVIDADVALVASIGIDHVDWLGDTREKIAYEKAGIFRSDKPAVCGDFEPPVTLTDYAQEIGTALYCQNQHFGFECEESTWNWWSEQTRLENLPLTALALQNMSTSLMAIELLQEKLPVKPDTIRQALAQITLPGRIQVVPGDVTKIYDVSHNPAAAEFLATWLRNNECQGKTYAVFSMLADKDIVQTIWIMKDLIDEWFTAPLAGPRAASTSMMEYCFRKANVHSANFYLSIADAHTAAIAKARPMDRIVVFGSFHTVAEAASQEEELNI